MAAPQTTRAMPRSPLGLPEQRPSLGPRRATTLPTPSTVPLPSSEFKRPQPVRRSSAPSQVSQASIYVALYDTLQARWGKRAEVLEVRAEWDRIVEASESRPVVRDEEEEEEEDVKMDVVATESDLPKENSLKREREDEVPTESPSESNKKQKFIEEDEPDLPFSDIGESPTASPERRRRTSSVPLPHPRPFRPCKSSPERTDSLLAVVRSFESMLSHRAEMWREVEKMRMGQNMVRSATGY